MFPASGEWNEPVWSLSAEIVGYAFFPLIAFALLQCRSPLVVGLGTGAALVATITSQFAMGKFGQNDLSQTGALLRMAGYFTAGIASRHYLELTANRFSSRWASAVAIVAVLGIAGLPFLGAAVGVTPVLFCALTCALYSKHGIVSRGLASSPALFLGKISFPLYLIHAMPISVSVAFGWAIVLSKFTALLLCYNALGGVRPHRSGRNDVLTSIDRAGRAVT